MSKISCRCVDCQKRCETAPGWFKPKEIEKAANFLGLSVETFFKNFLMIDYWMADNVISNDVFALSPAVVDQETGKIFPVNNRYGQCIFYKKGKCQIHFVKPYECKNVFHNSTNEEGQLLHHVVVKAWDRKDYQQQIIKLFGEKPEISEEDFDDDDCVSDCLGSI